MNQNNFEWKTDLSPFLERGISELDKLWDKIKRKNTNTFLVIRHDRIVCEKYSNGFGPNRPHYTASLAKALVGGLALALALHDKLLSADDPAWQYIPAWQTDPQKSKITVRHLASHSSGMEDAEEAGKGHQELTGWKGDFWKWREPPQDPFTISRDATPLRFEPGTGYAYSNPGMAMLGYVLTAALQQSAYKDIRTYLRERVMRPIGVADSEWACGYRRDFLVDGLSLVAPWGGGDYTARAVARVGLLMLHNGSWQGKRLIDENIVKQVTAYAGTPLPGFDPDDPVMTPGLGWWTNTHRTISCLPADAFGGAGAGNQLLLVVPDLQLIVVRNGSQQLGKTFWGGLVEHLFAPLMEAFAHG